MLSRAKASSLSLGGSLQQNYEMRYVAHDELKYSLRSLEKYAPFIRTIFIITDRQVPQWLKTDGKIRIIDHADIMPKNILPTFNSRCIEEHIVCIPGLSERFLYLNDDMILNRQVRASVFFKKNLPVVRFREQARKVSFSSDFRYTLLNAYESVLKKNCALFPFYDSCHGIDSFTKSLLQGVLEKHTDCVERNKTPFRERSNVQRVFWLFELAFFSAARIKSIVITLAFCKK